MVTDPASAETIKYASNAFLATKISFVNAVAAVCEAVGADVNDVVLGMGYDRRIGHEFLKPGPGLGWFAASPRTRALIRIAEDAGYDFRLLKGVVDVNDEQFERVAARSSRMVGGDVSGRHIVGVWGLTFKARTDDTRMSPAIEVIKRLQALGAEVTAYDPAIRMDIEGITVANDPMTACKGSELLMILTEWDEFKWVDLDEVAEQMTERRIVDTRNLLDRSRAQRAGFEYQGIGRR
jgi:UDPglucose 6-dehydrogenase